jgi:hypothetical protein
VPSKQPQTTTRETLRTPTAEPAVLTVKNCKDLVALFKVRDAGDPFVKKFSQKYYGKIIEFDGYCWDWSNHNNSTLFYTLIWVGNVKDAATISIGPKFRAENVRLLKLGRSTALNRRNVHIVGKVGSYEDSHEFLMLDVISINFR